MQSLLDNGFAQARYLPFADRSQLTSYSTTGWAGASVLHVMLDETLLQYPAIHDSLGILTAKERCNDHGLEDFASKVELQAVQELLRGRYPIESRLLNQLSLLVSQLRQSTQGEMRDAKINNQQAKYIKELAGRLNRHLEAADQVTLEGRNRDDYLESLETVGQLERRELEKAVRYLASKVVQFCTQSQLYITIPESEDKGAIAPLVGLAVLDSKTNADTIQQVAPVIGLRIGAVALAQSANSLLYTDGAHFWPELTDHYQKSAERMLGGYSAVGTTGAR